MRNVWLLGGDAQVQRKLEEALGAHVSHARWKVHVAKAVEDIREDDLLCNGNVIICDAFHPTLSAFEGVKAVRGAGFSGAVFLAGEPSPELAISPFMQSGLTGYFPSFERADFHLIAGMLVNQLFFEGELNLNLFLAPGGRASIETIKTFDDFNQFGAKLATFVGKFGIEVPLIKKLLMGLGLPHIKGHADGPSVDQPFQLHFGMDPLKLIVGVSSFSRGATKAGLLAEFTQMLGSLKDQKAMPGTIFPELFHVGQSTHNMMILSGNAKKETNNLEPLYLITAIPFPKVGEKVQGPINLFSFLFATPTLEGADEKAADAETVAPATVVSSTTEAAGSTSGEPAPASAANPAASADPVSSGQSSEVPSSSSVEPAPAGMIESKDVQAILTEPHVVGDQPVIVDGDAPAGSAQRAPKKAIRPMADASASQTSAAQASSAGATPETSSPESMTSEAALVSASSTQFQGTNEEFNKLRQICVAMGQDIRRLMRERRVPSTDRELRDAVTQMAEKLKSVQQERAKYQKLYDDKVIEIDELKTQVENLRKKAA